MTWEEIAALAAIAGLAATIGYDIYESKRTQTLTRREIYQRLELASVDLLRFEVEQNNLMDLFWNKESLPKEDTQEYFALHEYVFQWLNLFGMVVNFRSEKMISTEVFSTWIGAMYSLCSCTNFQSLWTKPSQENDMDPPIRSGYLIGLQEIIDEGIKICKTKKMRSFYEYLSTLYENKSIIDFYDKMMIAPINNKR